MKYRRAMWTHATPRDTGGFRGKHEDLVQAMRSVTGGDGYLEVETPMMQPIPGGAVGAAFRRHHQGWTWKCIAHRTRALPPSGWWWAGMERLRITRPSERRHLGRATTRIHGCGGGIAPTRDCDT